MPIGEERGNGREKRENRFINSMSAGSVAKSLLQPRHPCIVLMCVGRSPKKKESGNTGKMQEESKRKRT